MARVVAVAIHYNIIIMIIHVWSSDQSIASYKLFVNYLRMHAVAMQLLCNSVVHPMEWMTGLKPIQDRRSMSKACMTH